MGDGQSSPPLLPGSEGMGAMATSTQRDEDREQREQARAEKLEALHQTLTAQVAELADSEAWQAMLRAAARFHRYSFGNVCMILAQRPTATQVAGFHTWRSLGRSVTKGEKGIAILAPVTYKTKPTAEPHHGPDEPHDEKPDATGARRLHGLKVEYVFDIEQTHGEPLPDVTPCALEGDAPADLWDGLAFQVDGEGYRLRRGECARPTANGETEPMTKTVTVRADLPPAQACKTLAHELAHIRLGHVTGLPSSSGCLAIGEVEAESVAFMVSAETGLDSAGYSVRYGARGANGDVALIRATAERVIRTARSITDALEPYPIAV